MTPLQDSWKAGIAPWVINITLRGYNLKARCGLRPAILIHFSYRIVTQIYAIMSSKSGSGWNNKQQVLTTLFNKRIQEYSMSQHQWGHGVDRDLQISLGPFTWVDSACYSVKNQNKTFMIILIIHEPFKVLNFQITYDVFVSHNAMWWFRTSYLKHNQPMTLTKVDCIRVQCNFIESIPMFVAKNFNWFKWFCIFSHLPEGNWLNYNFSLTMDWVRLCCWWNRS